VKEHHPEGVYYLRYLKGKKRVWEPVGSDAPMALLIQRQRETGLTAQKAGVQIVEPVLTGRDLGSAIDEYLANVAVSKSAKTLVQYGYLLRVFRGLCTKPLEAITREDILNSGIISLAVGTPLHGRAPPHQSPHVPDQLRTPVAAEKD